MRACLLIIAGVLSAVLEVLLVPLHRFDADPCLDRVRSCRQRGIGQDGSGIVSSAALAGLPIVGWMLVIIGSSVADDEVTCCCQEVLSSGCRSLLFGGMIAGLVALLRSRYAAAGTGKEDAGAGQAGPANTSSADGSTVAVVVVPETLGACRKRLRCR